MHPCMSTALAFTVPTACGEVPRVPRSLCLVALTCCLLSSCARTEKEPPASPTRARTSPRTVRITMDALHQLGGIPAGWQLTLLPGDVEAGRRTFQEMGCSSCHKVAGESFPDQTGPGPDLTGMGSHHPPAYFLEAILNPDAVLVDGRGWVSEEGRSTMPAYPDLTITQLEDLVAYLSSLTTGDPHAGHQMPGMAQAQAPGAPPTSPPSAADLPTPPETAARVFFAQSYDVAPGKVQEFQDWFRREGSRRFLGVDGLVSVETFVDLTRAAQMVTSVWGFRDDAALNAFMNTHDPATVAVGTEFDAFVGPHDHKTFRKQPVYRAPALSAP
jgi:mono/diheme cytochrome c family protein